MTFEIRKTAFAAALCLLGAACTTAGIVPTTATAPSGDDTYFVLGVSPEKIKVFIVDGTVSDGEFSRSTASALLPFSTTLMSLPTDGFVVGKTHGGTLLSLFRVFDERSWPTIPFGPCKGEAKALVFTPAAGKVVYITSIDFYDTGSLASRYRNDLEGARAFLKKHYPNLADKLEQGSYQLVTPAETCPPQLY